MIKEKIATVDLIVYSLEQYIGGARISVRARKEGESIAYTRNSFFFTMEDPCKPPCIGEIITVTVEKGTIYAEEDAPEEGKPTTHE